MSDRNLRVCDACGVVDDRPRHIMWAPGAPEAQPTEAAVAALQAALPGLDPEVATQALRDLFDGNFIHRHMECCAQLGCPDSSCVALIAASGGLSGADLDRHIIGGNA